MAFNARGPIAESYDELQSLPALRESRGAVSLPSCSIESLVRCVMQGVEVALLNIHDLMLRAMRRPETSILRWAEGFHTVLLQLSRIPHICGPVLPTRADDGQRQRDLRVSPGYRAVRRAIQRFDEAHLPKFTSYTADASALDTDSPDDELVGVLSRCGHAATIWERNLWSLPASLPSLPYSKCIGFGSIRQAVYAFPLYGETYLMQFRALHQIPEILAAECGDHLSAATSSLQSGETAVATVHVTTAAELLQGILSCMPVITANLTRSEYHKIRENLGLTSGSHSVGLRYRAFGDLYRNVARQLMASHMESPRDPVLPALTAAVLRFRTGMNEWRDLHAHLARNHLGGRGTRSLIGSPDALAAVLQMRSDARRRDPIQTRFDCRIDASLPLADYFISPISLDSALLADTGAVTQRRFRDVQERTGHFASKSMFAPPENDSK